MWCDEQKINSRKAMSAIEPADFRDFCVPWRSEPVLQDGLALHREDGDEGEDPKDVDELDAGVRNLRPS